MPIFGRNWPLLSLASATLLALTGCLPRGAISIDPLFPPCEECGDGYGHRAGSRGCDGPWAAHGSNGLNAPDLADGAAAGPPAVQPPHSLFHPVPTRPVFTPWVDDEPETISTPPVVRRSMILASQKTVPAAGERATPSPPIEPVAPKLLPPRTVHLDPEQPPKSPAASDPDDSAAPPPRSASAGSANGWHAVTTE
jgi:hypothetical protein